MSKPKITDFNGVVLYNIELDGCLNGVYTNTGAKGEICNEINKKRSDTENNDSIDEILGTYDCKYFDQSGTLKIDTHPLDKRIYHFNWDIKGNEHEGVGYKVNKEQIVVTYWFKSRR